MFTICLFLRMQNFLAFRSYFLCHMHVHIYMCDGCYFVHHIGRFFPNILQSLENSIVYWNLVLLSVFAQSFLLVIWKAIVAFWRFHTSLVWRYAWEDVLSLVGTTYNEIYGLMHPVLDQEIICAYTRLYYIYIYIHIYQYYYFEHVLNLACMLVISVWSFWLFPRHNQQYGCVPFVFVSKYIGVLILLVTAFWV